MRKTDALSAYLAEERRQAFAWGQRNSDCLLFLAGWALRIGFPDFGANWREQYEDEEGARRMLEARGGAATVISAAVGQPSTVPPVRGDVGLWAMPECVSDGVGMICTGSMWVMRHKERGVILASVRPHIHWRMGFGL